MSEFCTFNAALANPVLFPLGSCVSSSPLVRALQQVPSGLNGTAAIMSSTGDVSLLAPNPTTCSLKQSSYFPHSKYVVAITKSQGGALPDLPLCGCNLAANASFIQADATATQTCAMKAIGGAPAAVAFPDKCAIMDPKVSKPQAIAFKDKCIYMHDTVNSRPQSAAMADKAIVFQTDGLCQGKPAAVCFPEKAVLTGYLREWKYVEGFNACLATVIVMFLGWFFVRVKVLEQPHAAVINKFIFKVALPCHIMRGIGFKTDFYSADMWRFVSMFLVLRVAYLIVCIIIVKVFQKGNIGDVAALWLASTWISTVILGVPIIRSAYGAAYAPTGVWAGVSSFLFQLPVMLLLFEFHRWEEEQKKSRMGSLIDVEEVKPVVISAQIPSTDRPASPYNPTKPQPSGASGSSTENPESNPLPDPRIIHIFGFRTTSDRLVLLGIKILQNHVIWGIMIGFVLSLTLARKSIDPGTAQVNGQIGAVTRNPDYQPWTGWFDQTLDWISSCTTPLALFANGMWLHGKTFFPEGRVKGSLILFFRMIVGPAIMLGLAKGFGYDDPNLAKCAVVIASIPISQASFAIAKEYNLGMDMMTTQVGVGCVFLLPVCLMWLRIVDVVWDNSLPMCT